jgi:hypothetical protein
VSGLEPLAIVAGQIENVGKRRTQISKINIGPRETINVSGAVAVPDVTNTSSWVRIRGTDATRTTIQTILGGEDGDLLFVNGRNIRMMGGGNLRLQGAFNMDGSMMIVFIYHGSNNYWFEYSRKPDS